MNNIFAFLERQKRINPNRTAFADGMERLTYAQAYDMAVRVAEGLNALGLERGDCVFVQMPNCVEIAVVLFACFRLGLVVLPALPAYRKQDMLPLCARMHPKAWIGPDLFLGFDYSAQAKEMMEESNAFGMVVSLGGGSDHVSLAPLLASRISIEGCPYPGEDDVAAIICTGGTTGFPKPVPRTHRQLILIAEASAARCGFEAPAYLADLPVGHLFILAVPGLIGTVMLGGKTVFSLTASPDEVFALIESEGATMVTIVPPLIPLWLEACSWDDADIHTLSLIEVGGAPVGTAQLMELSLAAKCGVRQAYGYTEGLVTLTRLQYGRDFDDASIQGLPIHPEDELRIIDESGHDVPPGESGELISRGPYLACSYWCSPDLNGAYDNEGWYHSGDRACMDGGRVRIIGRLKELINRNGEKFSPMEIESVLRKHPGIKEAVAAGVPSESGGDRVCVWVMAEEEGDVPPLADIRAFLMERGVAPYKLPEMLRTAESWPLSPFGKIVRSRLVESVRNNDDGRNGNGLE